MGLFKDIIVDRTFDGEVSDLLDSRHFVCMSVGSWRETQL